MKKVLVFTALFLCALFASAQTVSLGNGSNAVYTSCSLILTDYGGANGNYVSNRDDNVTIYSSNATQNAVQVEIPLSEFDVHNSDTLFIYDGPNVADSMLLAVLTNSIADSVSSPSLVYAATVRSNGSLTIRFKTDGDSVGAGFYMTTDCVRPCQRVNVRFDEVLSSKVPVLQDDGFYYLDVCPNEVIELYAYGDYPDNNWNYNQNDQTSSFHWDLSLEEIDSVGFNHLSYSFPEGRGYDVSLVITDSAGCYSRIPQVFRVRTSSNPIRGLVPLPDICTGDRVEFTTGYDFVSNVQVDTVGSQQATSLAVSDTIFLPDGQNCGQGCSYVSPVTFTAFSPSATIQSANDILYVRLAIEHSYIGDIWIRLSCPNNQYVSIMKKYSSGSSSCSSQIPASEWGWNGSGSGYAFFGQYYEPDGSYCDQNQNPMGSCWNYCWSNATNQGYQYSAGNYVYSDQNHINGNYCDSTNVAQMTNVFHPDGSFANLIGCPMNGTWSVEIMDGWGSDNGYVCGWELALDPNLLPQDWSYNVTVDTTYLIGPGADGAFIVPDTAGQLGYTVRVVDELGCVYDTVTTINVTPTPRPDLGEDFFICHNDMITLYADTTTGDNTTFKWNTGDETESIMVLTAGDYSVRMYTTNAAGNLTCAGSDTIHVGVYEAPVFNYESTELEGCAPLTVRFNNSTTPESANFEWMVLHSDGSVAYSSYQRSPTFELVEPDDYAVFLRATTSDGCVDSIIRWHYIKVNAQPIAEFQADPEISLMSDNNGSVHFINYADSTLMRTPGTTFTWDFADGEQDSETISPDHVFAQWGDYDVTLRIETETGCASEITHTVVVEQDLVFPNVITPNGDNVNDVFAIENLNTNINLEDPDEYRNNRLTIYDRWGQKVYDAKNYDTYSRGGTIEKGSQFFDGTGLSDGVYYYSFYYKGKAKTVNYNGSLTIIR